jgi:hypothetical protein
MGFFSKALGVASGGLVGDDVLGTGLGSTLFGDQGKGAAKSQAAQNAADRAFLAERVAEARGDILPAFGRAQTARTAGAQQALDVFRGALPQQLFALQQSNIGAQRALLGGLPHFQSAILGTPPPDDRVAVQFGADTPPLSQITSPEDIEQIKRIARLRTAQTSFIPKPNILGGTR